MMTFADVSPKVADLWYEQHEGSGSPARRYALVSMTINSCPITINFHQITIIYYSITIQFLSTRTWTYESRTRTATHERPFEGCLSFVLGAIALFCKLLVISALVSQKTFKQLTFE